MKLTTPTKAELYQALHRRDIKIKKLKSILLRTAAQGVLCGGCGNTYIYCRVCGVSHHGADHKLIIKIPSKMLHDRNCAVLKVIQ